jgi:hypothetical protein
MGESIGYPYGLGCRLVRVCDLIGQILNFVMCMSYAGSRRRLSVGLQRA